MKRLRLAFVVQRYGPAIDGGAEHECRRVAEALAPHHDIEVLTTCAHDYLTWKNVYPAGIETVNGVRVRRFPVERPRRVRAFGRYADWLYAHPHTFFDEVEWVRRQGPRALALVEWLRAHGGDYDGVLFFTYLYLPTILGLPLVAEKAILVPTAHDERPIYLDLFRALFRLPRALVFQIEEEQAFVEARFHTRHLPSAVIGGGVDPVPDAQPGRFRRQVSLTDPYLLYVGRVDVEKGCRDLVEAFLAWRTSHRTSLSLVLMGTVAMRVPRHPALRALGFRPETEKWDALTGATALVMPSPHESFSFVLLEAWAQGTPVLATARAAVLRGHVERSGGGLLYDRAPGDFAAQLDALLADDQLGKSLGERGRAYVEARYRWPAITQRYLEFLARVFG
ncbi:MAG TPA: glycosyltransferase family 4 protein [Methylomirabilota bacterium]|jgi:glycosyltransferase involved in cell wall biosynthesis|nr:glycosyltransferase family 4 protein [Methylomirabilota bacterium]